MASAAGEDPPAESAAASALPIDDVDVDVDVDDVMSESDDLDATSAAEASRLCTTRMQSSSDSVSSRSALFDRDSEDWDGLSSRDKPSLLELLGSFTLATPLERIQRRISAQTHKVRQSQEVLRSKGQVARERMVEEWRRRVPSAEEQLYRYRQRMRVSVDQLSRRWNDTQSVTMREKVAFIFSVINIFASGYLIGGHSEWFHVWYTVQLCYFMPIRIFTYGQKGYQYFLLDLCYFVNALVLLSIWAFPGSKRLFMTAYCLAFGNNAVAVIMWRNSLVFHSLDKVTSLFIHIMPCVTLHCIVHLTPSEVSRHRFAGMWAVKHAPSSAATAPAATTTYGSLGSMLVWSTLPYVLWQLAYHFLITVGKKDKIAAGRQTSFVWLRKSYSKSWIGRLVLALPENLQVFAFMVIQYIYAVLTMLPCPIWFHSRLASGVFLLFLLTWSIYNGSTYYIDVFGNRFQKELEALKADVTRWQTIGAEFGPGPPPLGTVSDPMLPQPSIDRTQADSSGIDQSLDGGDVQKRR